MPQGALAKLAGPMKTDATDLPRDFLKPVETTRRPPDPQELESLLTRYQRADQAAARQLIGQLSPLLLRVLASPAGARSFAEDLLQDCWLRIHKARHTYRPGEPVLPWVFAIARHTRVDALRRRQPVELYETAMEEVQETASRPERPSQPWESDLRLFVNELPESQRDVFLMLKVSGMSVKEVARATSSTIWGVKQKAHRAYQKLRCKITERSRVRSSEEAPKR
jgi:RNA polymerase sigma-70 factor (ECF subfamily)